MERSETINELATALAVAQGTIEGAVKDSANPFFKSKYADLASVWDAIRAPLSANGLSVMQLPSAEGAKVTITTLLAHKSGQWIQSALTMTAKEDTPQAVGSAITYARRYALQSIAGVAPEDDDGEGAQGRRPDNGRWAQDPTAKANAANVTQQAKAHAAEVAQQKLDQMKQGIPYSQAKIDVEVPMIPDPAPVESPTSIKSVLAQFSKIKEHLGKDEYYKILGLNGFTHANEIRSIDEKRRIYKEMAFRLNEIQELAHA